MMKMSGQDGDCQVQTSTLIHLSKLTHISVQCIGPWFLAHWQGQLVGDSETIPLEESTESVTPTDDVYDKDEVTFLRSLDPKHWKEQDHYAVLGLSKLRHKASDEDIKKAYRKKVLRHHPDKRKAQGEEIRLDDDYFTCITKAWEVLGNPRTRRSYDSVDPIFDDSIPSSNEYSRNKFYDLFGKAFELNARWSEKVPVPLLGNPDSTRDAVEKFYAFWYNFESWREYSYLDEEEKEKGQDREERKWIEKQNKAVCLKRKKEEMTRIRSLVDNAYSLDPRVQKFKQDDKDRKLAIKLAKKEAARARQEEEDRIIQAAEEEARRIKDQQEAEEKAKQKAIKAERDAHKKALKIQRTALRTLVKSNNYYSEEPAETLHHMASLEKICESLQVNELEDLVSRLATEGREGFVAAIKQVEQRIEEERQALMANTKRGSGASAGQERCKGESAPWTSDQIQLLIKAVKLFPAGTNKRWEVVANFINQHNSVDSVSRTSKEVISKAKDLQNSDHSKSVLKETVNKKAYEHFERDKTGVVLGASETERFDTPAEQQNLNFTPWTAAEQQLLEQALKTYPSTTPERWNKISACLPSRTKKECMQRYKDLAEIVKAKKAAQAAVQKS